MTLEIISQNHCFGGTQFIYAHDSRETKTKMRFAAFSPPQAATRKCPVVIYLSGLTCTEENVTHKAGAQRICAELGLIFIAPDTSPRGEGVPDDAEKAYDFGLGAGFYVDAAIEPWAENYRMRSYVERELPEIIGEYLPADMGRVSITGHSMGGHGALTIALRNPEMFKSVSAFSPIVSPINCPWGQKALAGYLGNDQETWREYDACALLEDGNPLPLCLVDQGSADNFLESQLKTHLFESALLMSGQSAEVRYQEGYDHSYYFIATFMEDHLRFHAKYLAV
ncbi:MAG: S-formylglutathione hydrolase [Hyphomonadaceae bacterium]|nr:MAG: S-formylglutathione hydrolase [Hyphomonadaceae bacterium]